MKNDNTRKSARNPTGRKKGGRQEDKKGRAVENHPIARAGKEYVQMVDQWFKKGEAALQGKEEEILAQVKLGVAGVKEEVASLTNVVEILRGNQHEIYLKLMRGLDTDSDETTDEPSEDRDGPVKVALIAMDCSIAAWLRLKEFFPEKTDSILTMLVHLDRLRRTAEKEFPDARKFVRPGFDTEPPPN